MNRTEHLIGTACNDVFKYAELLVNNRMQARMLTIDACKAVLVGRKEPLEYELFKKECIKELMKDLKQYQENEVYVNKKSGDIVNKFKNKERNSIEQIIKSVMKSDEFQLSNAEKIIIVKTIQASY